MQIVLRMFGQLPGIPGLNLGRKIGLSLWIEKQQKKYLVVESQKLNAKRRNLKI